MPTICKISLDAEEYRKELAAVVAETRAAQEKMAAKSMSSAPAVSADAASASNGTTRNISVTAEVSGLEDVQKLAEAVNALPSEKEVRVATTVDSGGLSKAREKAKEVSCGMIQISKDTEKVNDKNKSISTGIQNFGQRAKAALKDFKSDLLSGESALSQLKGGILSLLNPWSLVIAAAGALLTVGKAGLGEQRSRFFILRVHGFGVLPEGESSRFSLFPLFPIPGVQRFQAAVIENSQTFAVFQRCSLKIFFEFRNEKACVPVTAFLSNIFYGKRVASEQLRSIFHPGGNQILERRTVQLPVEHPVERADAHFEMVRHPFQ